MKMTSSSNTNLAVTVGNMAAKQGNVKALQEWLDNDGDPNSTDEFGWTPLLWAAVRGHADCVKILTNAKRAANQNIGHGKTGALAVHFAGQSGNVDTAKILLESRPDLIDAVFDLNGHTILLQSVFYGHIELAKYLLNRGARTDITTSRGLGPMELMQQFQNHEMVELIRPFDSSEAAKEKYYTEFLKRIAIAIPESEAKDQEIAENLYIAITEGLSNVVSDPNSADVTINKVKHLVDEKKVDLKRLAGPQQQPPLIVVSTGNNHFPPNQNLKKLRFELAKILLDRGADPLQHENHPMDVQTIIRAAVFNHLDILTECSKHLTQQQLADGINEIPWVNGLTAMHDTILRSTMADPAQFEGYIEQAEFFLKNGGRVDMEDFSGVTQRNIAERCSKPDVRKRLLDLMDRYKSN